MDEFPFKVTFEIGNYFEIYCLRDIKRKKYPNAHKNKNFSDIKYYDIYIPEISESIECKCDVKGSETPNICIEIGDDGKPSGLMTTKAKYWIHTDTVYIYLMLTENLRKLIYENYDSVYPDYDYNLIKKQLRYPVKQENGREKLMDWFLIKKELFLKYCDEVELIDNMKYNKLI